jgi:hypothetical protein
LSHGTKNWKYEIDCIESGLFWVAIYGSIYT